MQYFDSNNVKVFPCQRRNNNFDRESLLNTELNITNMINRLTDIKSFIINGLTINGSTLNHGECNIGGYYFNIINDIADINLNGTSNSSKLILKIKLETENVPYGDELGGMDSSDSPDSLYKGLSLEVAPTETINDKNTLILADWDGSKWVSHSKSHLKFNANSINVNPSDLKNQPYITDNESNLINVLNDLIIDDGEL